MKTAALKGLKSCPAMVLTKDGQLACPDPKYAELWQKWLDWGEIAKTPEFRAIRQCSFRRNDRVLPMLNHCLKQQIEELDLSALAEDDFPACFPPHITTLSFEQNDLTDIKDIMDSLPATLKSLNISSNPLKTAPEYYPPYLEKLFIYNDDIVSLSDDFVRALPASLKVLDLSSNPLASLPSNFAALPAGLERLLLIKDKLTDVPEAIFQLPASCEIYMSGNPIPPERLQQIEARINAPDYHGPRISLHKLPDDDRFELLLKQLGIQR